MKAELKEKILNDGDIVKFTNCTQEYGRAEFICCPVFKRGKLKEFYIWPSQQPDAKYYYKVIFKYPPIDFSVCSWSHLGIDNPNIWLHSWCEKHKCHSFRLYVPTQSNQFRIEKLSNFSVRFEK